MIIDDTTLVHEDQSDTDTFDAGSVPESVDGTDGSDDWMLWTSVLPEDFQPIHGYPADDETVWDVGDVEYDVDDPDYTDWATLIDGEEHVFSDDDFANLDIDNTPGFVDDMPVALEDPGEFEGTVEIAYATTGGMVRDGEPMANWRDLSANGLNAPVDSPTAGGHADFSGAVISMDMATALPAFLETTAFAMPAQDLSEMLNATMVDILRGLGIETATDGRDADHQTGEIGVASDQAHEAGETDLSDAQDDAEPDTTRVAAAADAEPDEAIADEAALAAYLERLTDAVEGTDLVTLSEQALLDADVIIEGGEAIGAATGVIGIEGGGAVTDLIAV